MRPQTDTRGLGVVKLFFTLMTSIGLDLSMDTSLLIVCGPFLGRPPLDPFPMTTALAVFVVGIVVLAWGSVRLFGVGIGA